MVLADNFSWGLRNCQRKVSFNSSLQRGIWNSRGHTLSGQPMINDEVIHVRVLETR